MDEPIKNNSIVPKGLALIVMQLLFYKGQIIFDSLNCFMMKEYDERTSHFPVFRGFEKNIFIESSTSESKRDPNEPNQLCV